MSNMALVNPANERLAGTQFSPEECWRELHGDPTTGRWSEDLAVYPHQSVDGLVSEFGGKELHAALETLPANPEGVRCPTGAAIVTPTFFELRELYGSIIHATPPFFAQLDHAEWERTLIATYHAAFDTARAAHLTTIAVPLLGAGARGAPISDAISVAAKATVSWKNVNSLERPMNEQWTTDQPTAMKVRFGVQDSSTAHALVDAIELAIDDANVGMQRDADHVDSAFRVAEPPPKARWTL